MTLAAQVLSLGALVVFERSRGRHLAVQLAAFGGRPHGAQAEAVVGAVTMFAVLMMLVAGTSVAAGAAYVTWLVRARQVKDRSSPTGPVAAAWLIPVVNLVAPALLVDDIWRRAKPPSGRRGRWLVLLTAWWLSWLGMLTLVTVRLPLESSSDGLTGVGVLELSGAVVAALLCAATVREVTRVQRLDVAGRLRAAVADSAPGPEVVTRLTTRPAQGSAPFGHTG